jgi:hypothetical protein
MKDASKHTQETAIISLEVEELESRIAPEIVVTKPTDVSK